MNDLLKYAEIALNECLNLKRNEQLLIITDSFCYQIGRAFFDAGEKKCKDAIMAIISSRKHDGNDPPEPVGTLIPQFDLVVIATQKSLSHAQIKTAIEHHGTRVVTLPGITDEIFLRTMNTDWRKLGVFTRKIAGKLSAAQKVRVKSKNGTDLTLYTGGRTAIADDGRMLSKGTFGNLPAGEVCIPPLEDTAEGTLVIDGAFSLFDSVLDQPFTCIIKEGKVTKLEGSQNCGELEKIFIKYNSLARTIAEFGIGTHESASFSGNILEERKVRGSVHISFGDNSSIGGRISAPIHLDAVIRDASVYLDDKLWIEQGNIL